MKKIYPVIPHFFSCLRIVIAPVLWYTIIFHHIQYALLLALIAMISDFFDGYFARRLRVVSDFGSFLDPLADKIVVIVGFAALCWQGLVMWWVLGTIVVRDIVVTFLRTRSLRSGITMRTRWFAKCKTALQFVALYVGIIGSGLYYGALLGSRIGITERLLVRYVLWWVGAITAAFTVLSGLQYVGALWWYKKKNR